MPRRYFSLEIWIQNSLSFIYEKDVNTKKSFINSEKRIKSKFSSIFFLLLKKNFLEVSQIWKVHFIFVNWFSIDTCCWFSLHHQGSCQHVGPFFYWSNTTDQVAQLLVFRCLRSKMDRNASPSLSHTVSRSCLSCTWKRHNSSPKWRFHNWSLRNYCDQLTSACDRNLEKKQQQRFTRWSLKNVQ